MSREVAHLYHIKSSLLCVTFIMWVQTPNNSAFWYFLSGSILFFAGAAIMALLMTRLAYKWPKLIKNWREIESCFGCQKNLKILFISISILVTISSTGNGAHSSLGGGAFGPLTLQYLFLQICFSSPSSLWLTAILEQQGKIWKFTPWKRFRKCLE